MKEKTKPEFKLFIGLHKIEDLVFLVNKAVIGKKGLHYQKLLKDWSLIIGNDVARYTIPTKISSMRNKGVPENILFIATNNSSAAAELVYQVNIIKEQINFYFGYQYVHQVKIVQSVFQTRISSPVIQKPLTLEQKSKSEDLIANYHHNDEIRDILANMAKTIVQRV